MLVWRSVLPQELSSQLTRYNADACQKTDDLLVPLSFIGHKCYLLSEGV